MQYLSLLAAKGTLATARVSACVCLRTGQASIFDSMWLVGIDAETAFPISFVLAVIAVEILDVRIAFERKDVGCDAVKEPAVMRYYNRTAREIFKCLFQGTHCVYV